MAFEPTPEGNLRCTECGNVYEPAGAVTHTCRPDDVAAQPAGPSDALAAELAATEADGENESAEGERKAPTMTIAGRTFRLVDMLPLGAQMELAEAWEAKDVPLSTVTRLLRAIIHPAAEADFEALLWDKTVKLEPQEWSDALLDGIRQMGGRPFPQ